MNGLTSTDLSLLSKLLGMVGSDHDGEALAAARKADALVRGRGRTWPEVLGLNDAPPPEADHIALARELLGRGKAICTTWEMRFLRGILGFKTLPDYAPCSAAGSLVQIANIIDCRGVF